MRTTVAAGALMVCLAGCGGGLELPPVPVVDLSVVLDLGCTGGCIDDRDCGGLHCNRRIIACGLCVECFSDADCGGGSLCDPSAYVCRQGCSRAHGCGPDAGTCELDAGVCIGCAGDADCTDPARPRCDPARRACVACLPQMDNCGDGRFCAAAAGSFQCQGGCKGDSDCTSKHCLAGVHQCVSCVVDADCAPGTLCQANSCVPGCNQSHACANGNLCCKDRCADVVGDPMNCGACGVACKAGWNCCDQACSNPDNDFNHCGGCNVKCVTPHAQPGCIFSGCVIGACDDGWDDCNSKVADGCETNIASDLNNCGGCRALCALNNAFSTCTAGVCGIGACFVNFANCDGDPGNGCEAALRQDPRNCGKCGVVCAQGQRCIAAVCQ